MTRFARTMAVTFWEEPCLSASDPARLEIHSDGSGVTVVTPHIPERLDTPARDAALAEMLEAYLAARPGKLLRWYYTPMMLPFSRGIAAA